MDAVSALLVGVLWLYALLVAFRPLVEDALGCIPSPVWRVAAAAAGAFLRLARRVVVAAQRMFWLWQLFLAVRPYAARATDATQRAGRCVLITLRGGVARVLLC